MKVKIELEPSKSPFRLFYFTGKVNESVELLGDIMNGPNNEYEVYLKELGGTKTFEYVPTLLEAINLIEKKTLALHNIRIESNVEQ